MGFWYENYSRYIFTSGKSVFKKFITRVTEKNKKKTNVFYFHKNFTHYQLVLATFNFVFKIKPQHLKTETRNEFMSLLCLART